MKDNDIAGYCAHLAELHRDMSVRFNDLFSLEIPGWVIDPFTEPSTEVPTHLEEELVSLQNDEDLLTQQRNKLNITECGDLRLLLTNLHPDVDSLIAMHQAHSCH